MRITFKKGHTVKLLVVVMLLSLSACCSLPNQQNTSEAQAFAGLKQNVLVYRGSISAALNQEIFSAFDSAEIKPERLVISSPGGDVQAGIELGEWIHQHKLNVEVADLCASSCANYVFPAANKKYLRKDSVLIWHGSAWQTHWDAEHVSTALFNEFVAPMRQRETALYKALQVDNLITVYGQRGLTLWDQFVDWFKPHSDGWDYSLTDMQRLGLTQIMLVDNEWDWRKYRPHQRNKVMRVKLGDEYQYQLGRFEL